MSPELGRLPSTRPTESATNTVSPLIGSIAAIARAFPIISLLISCESKLANANVHYISRDVILCIDKIALFVNKFSPKHALWGENDGPT